MAGQQPAGGLQGRTAGGPQGRTASHGGRGVELAELIMTHALHIGLGHDGRLPTERQLAHDLGVTRSSIRYALAIMEARGYISREVGRGTYLRPAADGSPGAVARAAGSQPGTGRAHAGQPDGGLARSGLAGARFTDSGRPAGGLSAFAPADVMMVRRLLEPPAMPLAVAWAGAVDFEEMDRCLAGGDRAQSYEEFEAWDLALHRSIIAATRSPLLVALYSAIEDARHGHIWGDLKRRSASAERRRLYQADHHEIVAALKARDSGGAVKAMRAHLARVSDHLNATDPAAGIWQ